MVLNIPDAKLLKEVFDCWLGEDDYDEDGKIINAEYQNLLNRLTHVAVFLLREVVIMITAISRPSRAG